MKPSLVHVYKDSRTPMPLVCEVDTANPNQIQFAWEAQLTDCSNTDCKPNNYYWQEVTEESDFEIESNNDLSTLTLKKVDQQRFYRCTASNGIGKGYQVWRVIPVTGTVHFIFLLSHFIL